MPTLFKGHSITFLTVLNSIFFALYIQASQEESAQPIYQLLRIIGQAPDNFKLFLEQLSDKDICTLTKTSKNFRTIFLPEAIKRRELILLWSSGRLQANTLEPYKGLLPNSATFSHNGALIASGYDESGARLWDPLTKTTVRNFEWNPTGKINKFLPDGTPESTGAIAFSPHDELFATSAPANKIHLWNLKTSALWKTLKTDSHGINTLAFSPCGKLLAAGYQNGIIQFWDFTTEQSWSLHAHNDFIKKIAFSPDGKLCASGSGDATIKILNMQTRKIETTLASHRGTIWSLAFSPDGKTLASGSWDKKVILWNTSTWQPFKEISENSGITSLALSPDGRVIAIASWDNIIRLWNISTKRKLRAFQGHKKLIKELNFSPDGKTLASCSSDRNTVLWNMSTEEPGTKHQKSEFSEYLEPATPPTRVEPKNVSHALSINIQFI